MIFDILQQLVLIFAHFKEIAFFFDYFSWTAAVRAVAFYQLTLGKESFARGAVMTFVFRFVDIAFIVDGFEDFLYHFHMTRLSGADEIVVGN